MIEKKSDHFNGKFYFPETCKFDRLKTLCNQKGIKLYVKLFCLMSFKGLRISSDYG